MSACPGIPCPVCGGENVKLRTRKTQSFGETDFGAKKIRFTGFLLCPGCLAYSPPASVFCGDVNTFGWKQRMEKRMLSLLAPEWKGEPR